MKNTLTPTIRRGASGATDPAIAVAEIQQLILQEQTQLILFFCAPSYDLGQLAKEVRAAFGDTPTIGCTTAGELGDDGFTRDGITAISFAGEISAQTYEIDLDAAALTVLTIAEETKAILEAEPDRPAFGLLLVDGLSLGEEQLASLLYRHLPQVPIVGGSAGDSLEFKATHVYVNGAFREHTAVFTVFRTRLPFRTVKFAHFVPTEHTLVITRSDPATRLVYEINGEPAALVYADLIGVPVDKLDPAAFSRNPLILEIGGEQYVRSIFLANSDRSLTMLCGLEDGMVLNIGRAIDPAATATEAFDRVREEIGAPALIIGCDCILRRLEFEHSGLLDVMGGIMKTNQVVGFSTYGEQYDGLHINQTFTGVALGKEYAAV